MHDELSTGTDRTLVATDHAQSHGVIGSFGNVLHLLQGCVQLRRGGEPCLLGRLVQVPQQQLVLADSLHRLDEEGVDALSLFELLLHLL